MEITLRMFLLLTMAILVGCDEPEVFLVTVTPNTIEPGDSVTLDYNITGREDNKAAGIPNRDTETASVIYTINP